MDKPSVLIAGAGPSGLVLAIVLLQHGVSVRIIDKQTEYPTGSRGAGIQPRTMELYDILGILPDIMHKGEPMRPTIAKYEPGQIDPVKFIKVAELLEPTPDIPHRNIYYVRQDHHEEVLRSHLEKLSCSVELGSELHYFEQFPNCVVAHIKKRDPKGDEVEETADFDWLVGADGARSFVRKQLGVSFAGSTTVQYIALGDIVVDEGLDPALWHMWDQSPKFIMLRPSGVKNKNFMFFYSGRPEELANTTMSREEFLEQFYELTGRHDVKFGAAPWLSNYRPNIRMVDRMQVGRVVLSGDAAHCHSATGGQGLNSSVHDAANLGWKLALVIKGLASQSLLSTYGEERLRVIANMLKVTTSLYNTSIDRLNTSSKMDDDTWARDGDIHMLGINYSGSSIILQEPDAISGISNAYSKPVGSGPARVEASFRAPDAPGLVLVGTSENVESTTSLFSIFKVTVHTVLLFGREADCGHQVTEVAETVPRAVARAVRILSQRESSRSLCEIVLEDRAGHAYAGYGVPLDKLTAVVVRPDGVVGAVVSDKRGLERYFKKIIGI
ncbi:FAD-binding-3 domain-containing protein [Favolaschia claudopus]|uniref:FAD-binding-3 domain-containing protein n=1 Tax=Favolaschia claudopus TaxID=2862362 RepID=A0AAW0DK22_9AGAR